MENYQRTEFVTLKNFEFAGSVDDLYDELAESGEDLVELGVPEDISERFDETGDGHELFEWLRVNALPLYIKEED